MIRRRNCISPLPSSYFSYVEWPPHSLPVPPAAIANPPAGAPTPRQAVATSNAIPQRHAPPKLPGLPWHVRVVSGGRRFARRLVRGWWAWEILSATVSLTVTVALVILLIESDGRVQPSWAIGSTQLTLNTLIAALATVIRAALRLAVAGALDQSPWNLFAARRSATHQPRGQLLQDLETFGEAAADSLNSAKLLYRTRGRYLASLGASIMILSLGFDTFIQQVLTINSAEAPGPFGPANVTLSAAVLPRVQQFVNVVNTIVPAADPNQPNTPELLDSAVIDGVLDDSVSPPAPQCPTGSCSWPVTPTIGICSACADARAQLHSIQTESNVSYSLAWPGDGFDIGAQNSTVTLQSSIGGGDVNTEVFLLVSSPASVVQGDGRLTIANFYALGASPGTYAQLFDLVGPDQLLTTAELDPLMVAYNCSFYFCLKGYSAVLQNGVVHQTLVATWDQVHVARAGGGNRLWTFQNAPTDLNAPNASAYAVDEYSLEALGQAFEPVIRGNASLETADERLTFSDGDPSVASAYVENLFNASSSAASISTRAQIIADTLTQRMRAQYAAAPDLYYTPVVSTLQLLVHVRWVWLIYPFVLVVAGLLFLALTIVQTRRRVVRPWKGHRIPLLLAHVDDSVRQKASGGLGKRTGLEDRVGAVKMRMTFDHRDRIAFERAAL